MLDRQTLQRKFENALNQLNGPS